MENRLDFSRKTYTAKPVVFEYIELSTVSENYLKRFYISNKSRYLTISVRAGSLRTVS